MGCPLGPDVEPAAKKTSSRYGLPTLFQPGLPSLGSPHRAYNKPMWASSWAAHLGLTWSPRPKKTSSRYGLPTLFQPGLPSLGSPHCAHNKPMWASSGAAPLGLTWSPRPKNIEPIWAAYIVPTWAAQSGQPSL